MKTININLGRELSNVKIITVADYHTGSPQSDENLIKKELEYVQNNKDVYAIINGDLIDNATKTSVGDVYTQNLSPMQQLEKIVSMLRPIKDKILCITSGNHEDRSYKNEGIDMMKIVASELGLQDRYSNASCVLFLRFGEMSEGRKETNGSGMPRQVCYTIYVTHGSGGGGSIGSKSNRVSSLQGIIDTDIYIISHMHTPNVFKEAYHRVDTRNSFVSLVDKLFVITGGKVKWNDSYAEKKSLKPTSLVNPIIHLNGKKKEFTAVL